MVSFILATPMSTHEYIGGSIKSKIRKQMKNYKQPIIHRKDETNFIRYFIILTIFILFGAVAEWPYGYYTILRWITCIASILVVFQAFEKNIDWAKVVFIVIAILFNPLFPVYLSRSTWIPLDIITAILFIFVIRIL